MRIHYKKRKNTGFTLMELLVTLSIVSILAYSAAPSLSEILQKKDLETAKNRIIYSLKKAKRIASAENTFVKVTILDNVIKLSPMNNSDDLNIEFPSRITANNSVNFTFNSMGSISNQDGESIENITSINLNPKSNASLLSTITISSSGNIASL